VTDINDDETTTDKIIANNNKLTKKNESMKITKLSIAPSDGVGVNQGTQQELGDQQALGPVEDILVIEGFITKRNGANNDGQNQFLMQLDQWTGEAKDVPGVWDLGRMGIIVNDDHTQDLIPIQTGVNQIAYLWEKLERKSNFARNQEFFWLYWRRNKGDGQ